MNYLLVGSQRVKYSYFAGNGILTKSPLYTSEVNDSAQGLIIKSLNQSTRQGNNDS